MGPGCAEELDNMHRHMSAEKRLWDAYSARPEEYSLRRVPLPTLDWTGPRWSPSQPFQGPGQGKNSLAQTEWARPGALSSIWVVKPQPRAGGSRSGPGFRKDAQKASSGSFWGPDLPPAEAFGHPSEWVAGDPSWPRREG